MLFSAVSAPSEFFLPYFFRSCPTTLTSSSYWFQRRHIFRTFRLPWQAWHTVNLSFTVF